MSGHPVDQGLVCFGDGAKDGLASGIRWNWNSDRQRYEQGSYTETRTEVFDASLMEQTWYGGGRIRLPRSLISRSTRAATLAGGICTTYWPGRTRSGAPTG